MSGDQPAGNSSLDVEPVALLGEVRTGLIPTSAALSREEAVDLLTLVEGRTVQSRERPISWARSPSIPEGVDCRLARSARSARGVGTVATHGVITGGRVLQSSASVNLTGTANNRRRGWGHYLARIGVVEVLAPPSMSLGVELVEGYLGSGAAADTTLDLGAIAARLYTRIRTDAMLNQNPPIHSSSTRLRWAARCVPGVNPAMSFVLHDDQIRLVSIVVGEYPELVAVQRFCEDLALHDWLLTVLSGVLDEAEMAELSHTAPTQVLAPLLEHLVHLWLPGASTPPELRGLWTGLEADPGFTVQWSSRIGQLRDRVAVATLGALIRSQARW
ncbi:SCO2521 family protein [Nocardia sp. NPDC055053]